jgi:hypothetical protein
LQKPQKKLLGTTEMSDSVEWKITRLPSRGPKPGQSQESFLRGKAEGDKKWDRTREQNFNKLLNPTQKPKDANSNT